MYDVFAAAVGSKHANRKFIVRAARTLPKKITVNVVLCEEIDPPVGEDAISWMLVTTMPIDIDEQVQKVISSYCIR